MPAAALFAVSGRPARAITMNMVSTEAGSVSCGSGVTTGVGFGVAGATDGGVEPQATTNRPSAKAHAARTGDGIGRFVYAD